MVKNLTPATAASNRIASRKSKPAPAGKTKFVSIEVPFRKDRDHWHSVVFTASEKEAAAYTAHAKKYGLTLRDLIDIDINGQDYIPDGGFYGRNERLAVELKDPDIRRCVEEVAGLTGKTVERFVHEAIGAHLEEVTRRRLYRRYMRNPVKGGPPVDTHHIRSFCTFRSKAQS
jgi:hypothetical protein